MDFPKTSLKEKFQEVKQVENIHKFKRIWTSVVWGYSWVVKDKLEAFSMLKINFYIWYHGGQPWSPRRHCPLHISKIGLLVELTVRYILAWNFLCSDHFTLINVAYAI